MPDVRAPEGSRVSEVECRMRASRGVIGSLLLLKHNCAGRGVDLGLTGSQPGAALLFWSPVSPVAELHMSSRAPWKPSRDSLCVDGLKRAE